MTLTGIIILVLLGIILIIAEIFFIPGIGIAGFLGVLLLLIGVVFAYKISPLTGHIVLAFSVIAGGGLTILAFRSETWEKVALKSEIDSKITQNKISNLKIGDVGKTVSRLAPAGKALINGYYYEVRTDGNLLDQNKEINIVDIVDNTIFVKEIKENTN